MNAISYVDAQRNLAKIIDQVCDRHDPVIITRHQQPSAVLLSLENYESLTETAYLLTNANGKSRTLSAYKDE